MDWNPAQGLVALADHKRRDSLMMTGSAGGLPAPAKHERSRKDVSVLGPGDTLEVVLRFRDFLGRYPIHCHNTVHEDHTMMLRWDVIK